MDNNKGFLKILSTHSFTPIICSALNSVLQTNTMDSIFFTSIYWIWFIPGVLQDPVLDDLRWSCCGNTRNKAHHNCNVTESSRNHPPWGQWANYVPRNWSLAPRLRPSFYSFNQWGIIYTLWKFIPFECTVLWFFLTNRWHHVAPSPAPIKIHNRSITHQAPSGPPPTPAPGNPLPDFCPYSFALSRMSCKWTHTACSLFRLVAHTQYNTFVSQLCVSGPFFIVAE